MARRSLGERFAAAFTGVYAGLAIGLAIVGILYVVEGGSGLRWRVLAAVVAYCTVFCFVVGEGLGDVLAGAIRIHGVVRGRPYREEDVPASTWIGSILVFLVFAAILSAVVFAALR
jgi:hypothetical protein